MSVDEIRNQKGKALLDYQEAEDRVYHLQSKLQGLSGTIEQFARLINPGNEKNPRPPKLDSLRKEEFKNALDHESAVELASQLADALQQLAEATKAKQEFGLR